MRSPPELHETTRRPLQRAAAEQRPLRVALTIGFHPQLRRIGERVLLADDVTQLSRQSPEFRTPEGRVVGALTDPYLSRTPVALQRDGDGVIVTAQARQAVRLDGRLLVGSRRVDAEALRRGASLVLAGRVLLLLHSQEDCPATAPKYGLVGESAAIQRVREDIALTAALPIPVLLRGESGTGKELVARAIHAVSPRAAHTFVSLNMAALNPQTAVAELFGHARGSFTGAVQAREGYFREADGGTIFLDEIGEASVEVQALLLRVLETGEIQPIGGVSGRRVAVRVIAATDARLEDAVRGGSFRLALFHRLAGFELRVPPLRDRPDDIPRLVVHFLAQELRRAGHDARFDALAADAAADLGPALFDQLVRDPWPGNVRQLSNTVRQMVAALVAGRSLEHLPALDHGAVQPPAPDRADPRPTPLPADPRLPARAAGDVSNEALVAAMERHRWNFHATARALGMSRTALYARVERCPDIRKAADIPDDELRAAYAAHDGDTEAMAAALRVSLRALQMRLHTLRAD
ncbi:MAG: sigma-54-dependent Fis family transcriptional regulator [Myxococcales bacterium]|nr:sigma-54-dependent Fis family transcriptional regulator [Myxococcales bacterium]